MAMLYLESPSTDPAFNLALEQHIFDALPREREYFMLWQNDNAVIVGRNQNTAAEVNAAFVAERGIRVVRRLSGGGAVYHDLGNINFTFVADAENAARLDLTAFCIPVVRALAQVGVLAEVSGRNDIAIGGQKFSGNAQYVKQGRVMHHGTIMYDCDLGMLEQALCPPGDKLEHNGVASVRGRVTNVKSHVKGDLSLRGFWDVLKRHMVLDTDMARYELTQEDLAAARVLRAGRYAAWEWNYGQSPRYEIQKRRRIEGCGALEVCMRVTRGIIEEFAVYGDFFGAGDLSGLSRALTGRRLERESLLRALEGLDVEHFIHGLSAGQLADVILR